MPRDNRQLMKYKFGAAQLFYWCTYCSFTTFFTSFIKDVHGVQAGTTGLLLALFMLSTFPGQIIINYICDRFQNNRRVYMTAMPIILLLYFAIYFSPNIIAISIFYIMLGMVQPALAVVLDTWVIRSFPEEPQAYGPIRSVGCISYATLALLEGFAIEYVGYHITLILAVFFVAGGCITAFRTPEVPRYERIAKSRGKLKINTVPNIMWLIVAILLFSGLGNLPLIQMANQIFASLGGGVIHMSIAIFANAASEFPTMQLSRKLSRYSAEARLFAASVLYTASTAVMFMATSPILVIAMYSLNGMAYGLFLPARRQIITEKAPKEAQNLMHGIGDAAYSSVGGVLGNTLSGNMLDRFGLKTMVGICGSVHALAMGVSAIIYGKAKRRELANDLRNRNCGT